MRRLLAASFALTACNGPELIVAELEQEELDASTDASMVDASDGRVRDVQSPRDARPSNGFRCWDEVDCFLPQFPHCLEVIALCVECEADRDCKGEQQCEDFQCRAKDRPRP